MFDQGTLNQLEAGYQATRQSQPAMQPQTKKGPGGIKGFLTNALPAIGGGLGAVAGIPLDIFGGAGSIAGGAAGAGLGETLKRHILGEKLDPKQIGIQALEGGATAAISPLKFLKGASGATKTFVKGGAQVADQTAENTATKGSSSFMKNLTTQGQQMQARGIGASAGAKAAGRELAPQDTARMLDTLKQEGITTGNANNTLRDVVDKQKTYGQQIADHFKVNDMPLHADDTKQIANNFLTGLHTTDPSVLKQAQIVADDLQKNVKSTKDLWEFRKTLDNKIPDSKFMDATTTNKVTALKSMRQYISDELGSVPGMKNYHDLAEIKPFVGKGARELNQPSGGIVGRLLSSGPVQQAESVVGKGVEKLGNADKREVPAASASPTETATPVGSSFMNSILKGTKTVATLPVRAATAPLAFPGQSAGAVLKQEAARGFGAPAAISQAQQQGDQSQGADVSGAITQASANTPEPSNDPFDPANVQANAQAIMQQGGTMKDVAEYLSNVKAYQELTTPSGAKLNATQEQQANNALSALQDIQSISTMINKDPSIVVKGSIPGNGNSIVQRLSGTTDYEAARNNIIDVISRLRSGAAISASEEKLYKSLLPTGFNPSSSDVTKLQRLAVLFQRFANPSGTSGSDVTDLLANAGGQ